MFYPLSLDSRETEEVKKQTQKNGRQGDKRAGENGKRVIVGKRGEEIDGPPHCCDGLKS